MQTKVSPDADAVYHAITGLRDAICRPAVPWDCPVGGKVGDLTEAAIWIGQAIAGMASAVEVITEPLTSANRRDSNGEPANIVDGLFAIADAIRYAADREPPQ